MMNCFEVIRFGMKQIKKLNRNSELMDYRVKKISLDMDQQKKQNR